MKDSFRLVEKDEGPTKKSCTILSDYGLSYWVLTFPRKKVKIQKSSKISTPEKHAKLTWQRDVPPLMTSDGVESPHHSISILEM